MLRDCYKVKTVWEILKFSDNHNFFNYDMGNWIYKNADIEHGITFIVACWMIWKAINAAVFTDKNWEDWHTVNQIHVQSETIRCTLQSSASNRTQKEVIWSPPPENFIKLNVDGSSFGNPGRSGYGGFLRDVYGQWICGFSGSCGFTTNLNAELMAILKGLNLAWSRGYKLVVCESDSTTALDLISHGPHPLHPHTPLINSIRSFWLYPWEVNFQHTYREGERVRELACQEGSLFGSPLYLLGFLSSRVGFDPASRRLWFC